MDEFGVLVESMGFRAQGKSTPLAELKPKPKSQSAAHGRANTQPFDASYSLPVDELDGIFRSSTNPSKPQQPQNFFGDDDVFGGPVSSSQKYVEVDLESVFSSSNNRKTSGNHFNSRSSPGFNDVDDLLGSKSKQGDHVDDLFGSFGMNSSKKQEERGPGLDDLIPGFGGASNSKTNTLNRGQSETNSRPPTSRMIVVDDPFLVFESSVSKPDASWPYGTPSDNGSGKLETKSSFDDFDDFIMGTATSGSTADDGIRTSSRKPSSGMGSNRFENTNFVDDIFGSGNGGRPNNIAKPSSVDQDSLFGDFIRAEKGPEVKQNSTYSFSTKKTTFNSTTVGDDFTLFFGEVTTSSGVFQEIEGESKERRATRLNRHIRTNERMAEALANKTQRDLQTQLEQDEKRRLAQTMDNNIRRWAAGKEGNLRALLSSLQEVLWPECGWQPVSLTDMITSDSVKKVYKKATLCVHPDKVQQKGARIEQKFIAEKVFDLLKEAWNKFSKEELR